MRTSEQACKAQALHSLSRGLLWVFLLLLLCGVYDSRLAIQGIGWQYQPMTATFTIDDAGQINLPDALKRVFGVEPGIRLRAEVTSDRIEIVKDIPVITEGVLENGVLVLPKLGIKMDAGATIRADRDEQAERALRR